eukprot:9154166-Pyramimonas_sp.AAC.1
MSAKSRRGYHFPHPMSPKPVLSKRHGHHCLSNNAGNGVSRYIAGAAPEASGKLPVRAGCKSDWPRRAAAAAERTVGEEGEVEDAGPAGASLRLHLENSFGPREHMHVSRHSDPEKPTPPR